MATLATCGSLPGSFTWAGLSKCGQAQALAVESAKFALKTYLQQLMNDPGNPYDFKIVARLLYMS